MRYVPLPISRVKLRHEGIDLVAPVRMSPSGTRLRAAHDRAGLYDDGAVGSRQVFGPPPPPDMECGNARNEACHSNNELGVTDAPNRPTARTGNWSSLSTGRRHSMPDEA